MMEVRDADSAVAFEELTVRYQSRVVTFLEHHTGNHHQAEELAQDVFLRVYRARKHYVPGAKFSTWLFTITGNVAKNAQRSRARRHEINLEGRESGPMGIRPLEAIAEVSSGQIPARALDKAEIRDVVRMAVQSLNERQRTAVLLSKFEGMSYAEIAETMEMSVQAIKSLLSRARGNLRDVLEPYFDQENRPEPQDEADPS
jgi:RNA polymerase sigma-70 factor (ECF subfamily)